MRILLRLLLFSCLGIAFGRAVVFLATAVLLVGHPLEAYHLEAKMVYLAWRAQEGLSLYPDWNSYPHESNFYGPLYFLIVGKIGAWTEADLTGLFRVGRWTTLASGLLAAVIVGQASRIRSGTGAGLFAGALAMGGATMVGFGAMARPDIMADTLGLAGFLLCVGRSSTRWNVLLGGALLVAAILTKQTTGLYLIASALALGWERRPRLAIGLLLGSGAAILLIILAATFMIEPGFVSGLMGDSGTPVSLAKWVETLTRLATLGPEIPCLTLAGLVLWSSRAHRDRPLIALAIVLGLGSILTAMKLGADLNYFLGLRLVAALAGGTLWGALVSATRSRPESGPASPSPLHPALGVLVMAVVLAILVPSLKAGFTQFLGARALSRPPGPMLREVLSTYRRFYSVAEDPDVSILTDSGLIALHQRARAPFVDPFLFRVMVEGNRIDPAEILRRIEASEYQLIITTKDLFDARDPYDTYTFGLPPGLAEAARVHYVPSGFAAGLFLYVPRSAEGSG